MHLEKLQKDMMSVKEEIDSKEFVGESSLVKVTLKGTKEIVKVDIDKSNTLDSEDLEMLEDMIMVAVNEAMKRKKLWKTWCGTIRKLCKKGKKNGFKETKW